MRFVELVLHKSYKVAYLYIHICVYFGKVLSPILQLQAAYSPWLLNGARFVLVAMPLLRYGPYSTAIETATIVDVF